MSAYREMVSAFHGWRACSTCVLWPGQPNERNEAGAWCCMWFGRLSWHSEPGRHVCERWSPRLVTPRPELVEYTIRAGGGAP